MYEKFHLTKEQAKKAADWWADAIRTPEYKNTTPEEDARDPNAGMIAVVKSLVMHTKPDDVINRFREKLIQALMSEEFYPGVSIGCDYHPDLLLRSVAEAAGIDSNITTFPWKTWMYFYPDRIEVAAGYRAEPVRL